MSRKNQDCAALRRRMVEVQLRQRGIHDEAVLTAFNEIPRELFLPAERADEAYGDHPVPIGHGQTISQPYVVALMVQELRPQPHHRILDVGAGSGYQTAILARLVAHVYGIERIAALTAAADAALAKVSVTNVTLRTGDGSLGWAEQAPFDGIICGAGAPDVPQAWIDQLADGGRIVLPVGGPATQCLVCVERHGDRITQREFCDVRFVKLIGRDAWSEE